MTATWINAGTILIGGLIGLLVKSRLRKRYEEIVFQALGLYTLLLGVDMGLKGTEIVPIILSLVGGALLGEWLRLTDRFESLGQLMGDRLPGNNKAFSQGLSTAFLLFCIGPMSTLGALEDGLGQTPSILYTKSILDGVTSIVLTAGFGIGILTSIIPLLFVQGGTSLLAHSLKPFLDEGLIDQLSSVGGVMLIGLGINILGIAKLRVMNMLPALLLVILLVKLKALFPL
ncbi:MAG: DUF554 domain-containing protein [Bacteroidota bacterium]